MDLFPENKNEKIDYDEYCNYLKLKPIPAEMI